MRLIPKWLLLLGIILVVGCGDLVQRPVTQPLSDPVESTRDDSLLGHWISIPDNAPENDKSELHAFVGKKTFALNPDSMMEFGLISWNLAKNTINIAPASFTATRLGKETYLNLFFQDDKLAFDYPAWTKSEFKSCFLLRYSCDGIALRIWAQKASEVTKLEETGELAVVNGVITAESLSEYLRRNGGERLFSVPVTKFTKSQR